MWCDEECMYSNGDGQISYSFGAICVRIELCSLQSVRSAPLLCHTTHIWWLDIDVCLMMNDELIMWYEYMCIKERGEGEASRFLSTDYFIVVKHRDFIKNINSIFWRYCMYIWIVLPSKICYVISMKLWFVTKIWMKKIDYG